MSQGQKALERIVTNVSHGVTLNGLKLQEFRETQKKNLWYGKIRARIFHVDLFLHYFPPLFVL